MSDLVQLAEASDLESRWRPLTDDETATADELLLDASAMLLERWPDLQTRIDSSESLGRSVVRIVCSMVKKAMLGVNLEGVESASQTAGPFGTTLNYANPNGNLYLSADDIRLLDGYAVPRAAVRWLV